MAGQGFISRSLRRLPWLGRYLAGSSSTAASLGSPWQADAAERRPQTLRNVHFEKVEKVEVAKAPRDGWASGPWASLDSFLPWWFKSTAKLDKEQEASTDMGKREELLVPATFAGRIAEELDASAIHRLRHKLSQQLRAWPVDVDFDKKLGAQGIPSKQVVEKVWAGAVRILIDSKDGEMPGDFGVPPSQLGQGIAEGSVKNKRASASSQAGEERDSIEDARRAVSFFKWLQSRHPGSYLEPLLTRLVFCLAKAELAREIAPLADFYRARIHEHSADASMLITIYYWGGAPRETVQFYKDAQESGLSVSDSGIACVLLAMKKLQFPAQDLLAVYKSIRSKTKVRSQISEALLAAGVGVEQMVEDVDGSALHKVKSRLIPVLAKLGRFGEARILAREFLKPDVSCLDFTTLVLTLVNMASTGLVYEAQQLADRSKELYGVNLSAALSLEISRFPNARLAVQAYLLVMHLDGAHRESFALHYEAVRRCVQLRDAVSLWQAYQAAMRAKDKPDVGAFSTSTFRRVLEILAQAGRVVQVEEVLADCYSSQVQWSLSQIEDFRGAYQKMGAMYIAQRTPGKLVELAHSIGLKEHWVEEKQINFWATVLKDRGLVREAVQLDVEGLKMLSYRRRRLSQFRVPFPLSCSSHATT